MQRPEEELIDLLNKSGVDFTASLPCEKIKNLLEMIAERFQHIPLTREEEGVGICAGASLCGRRPAMFVQSSGIGNMINALLSLTAFYELPLALFVSRRGVYQEKIEAQLPMGLKLPAILSGAGIGWTEIDSAGDLVKVARELPAVYTRNQIHAFLLSPRIWEGTECVAHGGACGKQRTPQPGHEPALRPALSSPALTRYDSIEAIAPFLAGKVVVSNLGWPSKELYALKHQPSNFYMLGSMGMVTPLGLGIALTTKKGVVVIDGDGSLLMNPGTLATAASLAPKNLTILCIDNGAYGSTGNQPTLTRSCVDLEAVARGFGFTQSQKTSTKEELLQAMRSRREGPTFIHALAVPGNRDVPNIPTHHLEIKRLVQTALREGQ